MGNYEIKIIEKKYLDETLDLFNKVFGFSKSRDFWINKHYKNPLGNSIFVGAFDNQKLIGMNAFMPIQYFCGNKIYKALESCESAVDANYRHQGIFSQLIRFMEEWAYSQGYDFLIGFPNIYSYSGFVKLGWETINIVESLGRISNIYKWLFNKKVQGIRPIADSYLIINYIRNLIVIRKNKTYSINEVDIETFLSEQSINHGEIHCLLSYDFLKWKLNEGGKIYFLYDLQGIIAKFIVVNGNIVYYDVLNKNDKKIKEAFDFLCQKLLMNEFGMISVCVCPNSQMSKIIRKAGFVTKRQPQQTIIIKRLSDELKQISQKIIWKNQMLESD